MKKIFPMHSPEPELPLEQKLPSSAPNSPMQVDNFSLGGWMNRLMGRLSIRQKISIGYVLAISLAIFGVATGRIVESYYKKQASQQLRKAHEAAQILTQLQDGIGRTRNHQQQLLFFANNPVQFQAHRYALTKQVIQLNFFFSDMELLLFDEYSALENPSHAKNYQQLKELLHRHEGTVNQYANQLYLSFKKIGESQVKNQDVVLEFAESQAAQNLIDLSDALSSLLTALQQETSDEFKDYQKAESLSNQILVGSLLISLVSAVILAIYISRAIARPIEMTTQVAQQVTKESNFDLQAPVTTQDEIGLLTISLNQLIQRVAQHTKELQQAQSQLIQNEKMSSLGQIVGGIAHEINNPVTFISGNLNHTEIYLKDMLSLLDLYQKYYPKPVPEIETQIEVIDLEFLTNDLPKTLASMRTGTERIAQLVLSLRNFSRLDEAEFKKVNLQEGIENTLLILNHALGTIEISKNYGHLPLIECYPAQLNQVFMSLFKNAIDALEESKMAGNLSSVPKIIITTRVIKHHWIEVKIADNGMGIKPEILPKIFDPFFTTKPVGKGTGLGLAVCYQIVEQHGGKIKVNSQRGQGTEFKVRLPIQQGIGNR